MLQSNTWVSSLAASMLSGTAVVAFMTPMDVVSTRLYNQGTFFLHSISYYQLYYLISSFQGWMPKEKAFTIPDLSMVSIRFMFRREF